jgi:protein TonB
MQPDTNAPLIGNRGTVSSIAAHALAVAAILLVLHHGVRLAAYKLPGTTQGTQLLTYYAPGSTKTAQSDLPTKAAVEPKAVSIIHSRVAAPKPPAATATSADRGAQNSGQSGLGDGAITIALQKYFPYPRPSLKSLPHGTAGDVVLDAVIDEQGKIAELTLLQGLGPDIDAQVIATVHQWLYTPAMKNGVPVTSMQELHFHYQA